MSYGAAESLAREVVEGTYVPATLADCSGVPPVDRNPHVIRFVEFTLFTNPNQDSRGSREPEYLVFRQVPDREGGGHTPHGPLDDVIKSLAGALARSAATTAGDDSDEPLALGHGDAPDGVARLREVHGEVSVPDLDDLPPADDARVDVDRLRTIAAERRLPGYSPRLPDTEVRALYRDWVSEEKIARLTRLVEPLVVAGFPIETHVAAGGGNLANALTKILGDVFRPEPYQPFRAPHLHVALCLEFEQIWEPKGYTRGELINTISLAPGEQMTLEVHSWDKSTAKSEEELVTETELRVAETLTQRDAQTVAREVATQAGGSLSASGTVPIKGVPVSLGGNVSGQINTNTKTTLERTRERTVEASQTLKSSRKLRIEVAREVGRERKQTHTVTNTNRCHTLNCHYFEVMANYLVSTRLLRIRPVLLIRQPRPRFTPAWVLCHEAELKEALLDRTYLDGFNAARVIEADAAFKRLKREQAKASGEVPEAAEAELKTQMDAVLNAYKRLRSAAAKVRHHARSTACVGASALGPHAYAVCVAGHAGLSALRKVVYYALLQANPAAIGALKSLHDARDGRASQALRAFFAAVSPRDFRLNEAASSIGRGLSTIGISGGLVDALVSWGLLDLAANDAGLAGAVEAAADALERAYAAAAADPAVTREGYGALDVATAQVAFDRLRCHLTDYHLHYLHAIWLRELADERFMRLQTLGAVSAALATDIAGFLGDKAAYPLLTPQIVREVDLQALADGALASTDPPPPRLVTMPTPGTILEAILGQCDGCDDFIRQSRVLDLRTQEAKARHDEADARRRELRLAANDLTDPGGLAGNKVTVTVDGSTPPTP